MIFQDEVHPCHADGAGSTSPSIHIYPRKSKGSGPVSLAPGGTQAAEEVAPIWALCLYLAFCFGCFFDWELPRLNHDNYVRFGADSPTYWDAVKYREEHAENNNLVSFSANLAGAGIYRDDLQDRTWPSPSSIFCFFL